MFFKVWLHLGKRVRTRAIHLPVYADAAEGATLLAIGGQHLPARSVAGRGACPTFRTWRMRTLRARHIPWHMRVARRGLVRRGAPGVAVALVPVDARRRAAATVESRLCPNGARRVAVDYVFDAARAVLAVAGAGGAGRPAVDAGARTMKRDLPRSARRCARFCAAAGDWSGGGGLACPGRAHATAVRPLAGVSGDSRNCHARQASAPPAQSSRPHQPERLTDHCAHRVARRVVLTIPLPPTAETAVRCPRGVRRGREFYNVSVRVGEPAGAKRQVLTPRRAGGVADTVAPSRVRRWSAVEATAAIDERRPCGF